MTNELILIIGLFLAALVGFCESHRANKKLKSAREVMLFLSDRLRELTRINAELQTKVLKLRRELNDRDNNGDTMANDRNHVLRS